MYRNDFFVYAREKQIRGKTHTQRLGLASFFVRETFDKSPEHSRSEPLFRRFDLMFKRLAMITNQRNNKPTFVVYYWDDINDKILLEKLLGGSFSVIIVDELHRHYKNENYRDWIMDKDDKTIISGTVLNHIDDVKIRMRRSLTSFKGNSEILRKANLERIESEGLELWGEIERVAPQLNLTTQQKLATHFKLSQGFISKRLDAANKRRAWNELAKSLRQRD